MDVNEETFGGPQTTFLHEHGIHDYNPPMAAAVKTFIDDVVAGKFK
jgi:hypothetical protein